MTRRCGSASRRFERKDRLEVQPVFFVYAAQFRKQVKGGQTPTPLALLTVYPTNRIIIYPHIV